MHLSTFSYSESSWSVDEFPDLDSDRTLVLAFCAPEFRDSPEAIEELVAAYPRSHVLGCSTSGEILLGRLSDNTLAVAVAKFDAAELYSARATINGAAGSFAAGEQVARDLIRPGLRAVLVLSDGLSVNGSELVRGINSVVPEDVVVTGGLAGDADRFESTWVIADGRPCPEAVTAVGLCGDSVAVGHGSRGGWDIFGPQRLVTRSEGNVLYELDGRPALPLYKRYLGELADGLPATGLLFPLQVDLDNDEGGSVVRTILSVDEESQSLTYAGDIPDGALAQLMRANFDRLIEGAGDAASSVDTIDPDGDVLVVDISCVGRRLVLGERCEEEIDAVVESLPASARHVGFYSYGELSPLAAGTCDLHNQTMTITTFAERRVA